MDVDFDCFQLMGEIGRVRSEFSFLPRLGVSKVAAEGKRKNFEKKNPIHDILPHGIGYPFLHRRTDGHTYVGGWSCNITALYEHGLLWEELIFAWGCELHSCR